MKECVYVDKQSKLQCMNVAQSVNINKRLKKAYMLHLRCSVSMF